jgi:hypothetical protein
VSYFSNPASPEDYEDGYSEEGARRPRRKIAIAILLITTAALGSTFAANISLNGGQRKEFGQGIFQIKACDQWVGIGLTAGSGVQADYVKNVKLYGFDPQLCLGRVFKVKLFPTGSTTALPLYVDETTTGLSTGDTTTTLTLLDTSTAYSPSYPVYTGMNAYQSWSADAVTLINALGTNIKYNSKWLNISYTKESAVYTIILKYPAALVGQVASVTIESAKYN